MVGETSRQRCFDGMKTKAQLGEKSCFEFQAESHREFSIFTKNSVFYAI